MCGIFGFSIIASLLFTIYYKLSSFTNCLKDVMLDASSQYYVVPNKLTFIIVDLPNDSPLHHLIF